MHTRHPTKKTTDANGHKGRGQTQKFGEVTSAIFVFLVIRTILPLISFVFYRVILDKFRRIFLSKVPVRSTIFINMPTVFLTTPKLFFKR